LFLLRFDDADHSDAIYRDRTSAREAFAKAEGRGWNCYLFELMPRSYGQECTSKAAAGQAVELTKDQLAAIQFYNLNPSAAQVDLESRLSRSVEDRRPVALPVGEVVQTGGLRGGPKRYKVKWLSDAALVNGTQLYTASPAAVEQKQVADDSSELSLDQRMSAFEFDLGFSLFHSDFTKTREAIQKLQGEFKALRSYALNREMQAFLMSPATPPAALVGDADAIWEQAISEVEAGITLAEIKPNHIPGLFQILRSNVRNKRKKSVDAAMAKEKP